jgi:Ca-activated chloride channel family protein
MKHAAIAAILTVVVSGAVAAQKTFRASVDLVNLNVFVTDNKGTPIIGLKATDFEIVEGGTPQEIKFFAEGDPEDAPPLHLGFLLDASGSMEEDLGDVRTAAIKFLKEMEKAADITLVDFDTEVRVARFRYEDYPRLIERIRGRKPGGMTALYDALGTYLGGASEQIGQKILIMYTDGGDTRSAMSRNEALNVVRASDVTVYVIGYLEHQSASGKMEQRQVLQQFAEMTGGQAFFPYNLKEVDKVYEKIHKEINARYSLGYTSADERTDGAWRKVDVRLKRPDLRGAKLRTRDGYFAAYRKTP